MAQKLVIDKDLLERAEKHAATAGYSSVSEFVSHLIEKELAETEKGSADAEDLKNRLQGLGYID